MSRGIDRERAVRKLLEADGWLAFRAPASLGCADVIAMRRSDWWTENQHESNVRLIEVKSTARGPYEHFGPAARQRLRDAAELAGADAYLAHWPSRGRLVWYHESGWPA